MSETAEIPGMTDQELAAYAAVGAFGLVDAEGKVEGGSASIRLLETAGYIDSYRYALNTPSLLRAVSAGRQAGAGAQALAAGRTAGRRVPLLGLGLEAYSAGPSGLWEGATNFFNGVSSATSRIWNAGVNARNNDRESTVIEVCDGITTYYNSLGRVASNIAGPTFLGSAEGGRGVMDMLNWDDPAARERGRRLLANNNPFSAIANAASDSPVIFMEQGLNANQLRSEVFRELGVSSMFELNDFRDFKEKMLIRLRAYKAPGREGEITHVITPGGNVLLDDAITMVERLPDALPPPVVALRERIRAVSSRPPSAAGEPVSPVATAAHESASEAPLAEDTSGGFSLGKVFNQLFAWISHQIDRVSSWVGASPAPAADTTRSETAPLESRTLLPASGYENLGTMRPLTTNSNPTPSLDGSRGVSMEGVR